MKLIDSTGRLSGVFHFSENNMVYEGRITLQSKRLALYYVQGQMFRLDGVKGLVLTKLELKPSKKDTSKLEVIVNIESENPCELKCEMMMVKEFDYSLGIKNILFQTFQVYTKKVQSNFISIGFNKLNFRNNTIELFELYTRHFDNPDIKSFVDTPVIRSSSPNLNFVINNKGFSKKVDDLFFAKMNKLTLIDYIGLNIEVNEVQCFELLGSSQINNSISLTNIHKALDVGSNVDLSNLTYAEINHLKKIANDLGVGRLKFRFFNLERDIRLKEQGVAVWDMDRVLNFLLSVYSNFGESLWRQVFFLLLLILIKGMMNLHNSLTIFENIKNISLTCLGVISTFARLNLESQNYLPILNGFFDLPFLILSTLMSLSIVFYINRKFRVHSP